MISLSIFKYIYIGFDLCVMTSFALNITEIWRALRFVTSPAQNRSAHRGFVAKQQQREEKTEQKQVNGGQRQWPQTLDSRFANLKEERMRMSRVVADERTNVSNSGIGLHHHHQQQQHPMVQWGRRPTKFPY
uniref:Uncharacterized protein n=1 Tax=Noccaea caerulescens TaxID=107243 RepID=A0A1J3JXK3_NOCCA